MATSMRYPPNVYFVESLTTGLIKIGFTRRIDQRLERLRSDHHAVILLAVTEGGRAREMEIHATLGRFRVEGEWFAPSPLLLEYIAVNGLRRGDYKPPVAAASVIPIARVKRRVNDVQVGWLLHDEIILQIRTMANSERKRQSAIAERLLMKGLEAESKGAKHAASEETDVA